MRTLAWVVCVLLLPACTRDNGAFDGAGGSGSGGLVGSASSASSAEEGASRTDGADGPASGTSSSSTSSVDGPEPPLTTGSTSLESTSGGGDAPTTSEPPQDCCTVSERPGCADDLIEGAVCVLRESCCNTAWDEACVELTAIAGFGDCDVDLAQCCEPSFTPGCGALAFVEECVCALDDICCLNEWHPGCVNLAIAECGSTCEHISTCCFPHPGGGCDVPKTEACVCNMFADCCAAGWGESCVNQAFDCGGGTC